MEENKVIVYVQLDSNNVITQIDSSIFLTDTTGWIGIDQGIGDKYSHAQGNYLENGLIDGKGKYNYKLVESKVVELMEEEKLKMFPTPKQQPTLEEVLSREIVNIKIDNMKKDSTIANALQTIADLKVEFIALKGGNV